MLAFLTDEHISHVIAEQVRQARPDIRIESVLRWRNGSLRGQPDEALLQAATEEGLAVVSYDQKTIPPLLLQLALSDRHHSGVVFVDRNAISSSDIGGLVRGLISLYDAHFDDDWTDQVIFLSPVHT